MRRKKNSGESKVYEKVLRARWFLWRGKNDFMLEVFVVGKWRTAGNIHARKPRKLTKKDVASVAKSVRINTGGEIGVIGIRLEE